MIYFTLFAVSINVQVLNIGHVSNHWGCRKQNPKSELD